MNLQVRIAARWACAALAGLILGFLLVNLAGQVRGGEGTTAVSPQELLVQADSAGGNPLPFESASNQSNSCSDSAGCGR